MADGLFDFGGAGGGGFDMEALMQMINPMGTANAAGAPPLPIDRINQGFSDAGPGGGLPFQAGPGVAPPPIPQIEAPISPPAAPITRSVTPAESAAAPTFNDTSGLSPQRMGLPRPVGNPDVVPPGGIGAALMGAEGPTSLGGAAGPMPLAPPTGTSGATDISAQAKKQDDAVRGGLAGALKGVGGIKPPEVQKIASPNAPRATGTIKSGDLQALLLALNAGAGGLDRKLPMTLGQGIGRG